VEILAGLDRRPPRPPDWDVSTDEIEIVAIKELLRAGGWYVRYTEWPSGHQVVLHRRRDTAVHVVTAWWSSEVDAWREALALASRGREIYPPSHGRPAAEPS
jgi:hypothetical protein